MTEKTIREFLNDLAQSAAAAAQDEHELLNTEVGLTRPRFTADQLTRSATRIAQRVQSQRARAQSQPAVPRPAQSSPASQPQRSAPPPQPAGPKFCTKCGARRQPDKRFCTQCGERY